MREIRVLDDMIPARRSTLFDNWWKLAAAEQEAYRARIAGENSA
jgi:hypothetical protein